MKVLLTGVAGFIGSHLAKNLVDSGYTVVGLDDLSGGFMENVPEGVEYVQGDIGDRVLIESLFAKHQFEIVCHLAAYAAEGLSHFVKRFNYVNNLDGSVNLIACAVNYKCKLFLFTSSIAVYGTNQLPMVEDLIPQPEDSYGIAKYAFEMEQKATKHMFDLPYIVFRPHNVYGEGQNIADRYRNVVGIFIRQAMQGEQMTVFGDGKQTRAFSYIGDITPIMAESINLPETWNTVYNIGADKAYTVLDIAEQVSQAMGVPCNIKYLPSRNEVVHAYADHSKVRRTFGERQLVSLQDGIKRMVEWARNRGLTEPTPAPPIEISRNLPAGWGH